MNVVKFLIALILTLALVYFLGQPITTGDREIPALGYLLDPFHGIWKNAEPVQPKQTEESLDFPELNEPVTVLMDENLVPHLFAESSADAFFAQGYLTAKYRLFQMDLTARSAGGRLSEVLGTRTLELDRRKRQRGMLYAAENALKGWKEYPDLYSLLEQYRDGVNAYISQLKPEDYPIEYKLIGFAPEPWTVLKTALTVKAMAETLCAHDKDIEFSNAYKQFGRDTFDMIFPDVNPLSDPVIPRGTPWSFQPKPISSNPFKPALLGDGYGKSIPSPTSPHAGSNNWAVDGSKTESGHPILCNDPHLNLTLPSIWFQNQIKTPTYNVYGVSLPGIPGIVIGFNEHVAWGVTNVGHDVGDWYEIQWTDDQRTHYMYDEQRVPVQYRIEEIKIKGEPTFLDTVRYTVWGPVMELDGDRNQHMAYRWIAHDVPNTPELNTFLDLNQAKGYDDYVAALQQYISPAQNFAFASSKGDIAITVNGRLPLKRPQQGRLASDGSTSANAWSGFIPMDQLPRIKNPERGFISSANQRSADTDYPYYFNGKFEHYRGRILNRLLSQMDSITIEDMKKLQNNNYNLAGEEMTPLLLASLDSLTLNPFETEVQQALQNWNYTYDPDEIAPVYFEEWRDQFYELLWDEVLQSDIDLPYPANWRTIALLKDEPDHFLFDIQQTTTIETAQDIAIQSFKRTIDNLEEQKAAGKLVPWGAYAPTTIRHLARIPAFSRDGIENGGSGDVLNATNYTFGPSWRMIVDLNPNEIKAEGIYPGGQSGNPGSPFYDNMLDQWAAGEYRSLHFLKEPELESENLLTKMEMEPSNND